MKRPHKKSHLAPAGVVLERRRYIGFARQPVLDDRRNFPDGVRPYHDGDTAQDYGLPSDRPRFDS